MRQIITIWKKELKDSIRDRRTLISMIVMPLVLMPLLIIGMGKFIEYQAKQSREQTVQIGFINENKALALVEAIQKKGSVDISEVNGDAAEAVKKDVYDVVIVIPADFNEALNSQKPIQIKVLGKSTSDKARTALARINLAVKDFNDQLLKERFAKQNINQNILSEVSVQLNDINTEKERGGFGLAFLLPLFIVMWSVLGGQYTAIDASAGEKERKTLESLLLTPVKRLNIVFGKFLAVATAALISVVISLGSFYTALKFSGFGTMAQSGQLATTGQSGPIVFSLDPQALALLFGVSLLLVLMFSAVILSIAIFAKSFKEAQSYIGPSYLVVILPIVIMNMVPNLKPALWFFALPAVNAVLLFKEILVGVYNSSHIFVVIVSLIVYSIAAILIASRIYNKESVLFKD